MTTIPWQFNFNSGGGLEDRTFFLLNVQPVMPFQVSHGWNMIVRTIVAVLSAPGPETSRYAGIGDIQEQIYLTPSREKLIWGAGPVLSLPTATTAAGETGSWAAVPTFVALTTPGTWVIGAVVNNVSTFSD